jgi:D-sedoheptulose 7-phosphate isomerase
MHPPNSRLVPVADEAEWLRAYFEQFCASLLTADVRAQLTTLKEWMTVAHAEARKTIIAGNGGSAAIASHCALDFSKNAHVRCVAFTSPELVTALANDCGYETWVARALELYADDGDVIILFSSSGKSRNMLEAADYARSRNLKVVTFTGFAPDNPLRALGNLNVWVESRAYNIVEMTHHVWLLAVCDLIIGTPEYDVS